MSRGSEDRRADESAAPFAVDESFGFATRAVHAGARPDPVTGSRNVPIHQTTAYVFDDVDHAAALFNLRTFGYVYSRLTNPTVAALEERIAALEGGRAAVAAASGHAAQLLAFYTLLDPGDHVVAARQLYGGSLTQLRHTFGRLGWNATFVDATDLTAVAAAIGERTKAVFVESLANPGGVVVDLEALACRGSSSVARWSRSPRAMSTRSSTYERWSTSPSRALADCSTRASSRTVAALAATASSAMARSWMFLARSWMFWRPTTSAPEPSSGPYRPT
jgi:Cys/Met metabolism PLP-dependent enzyme